MKKILILLALIVPVCSLRAQEGARLLTSFKESSEIENQNWAICQDDHNVMLFANRKGILTFDGQAWNFISIPTIPYTIKYNPKVKKVFVGGENNFGYLSRNEIGTYKYFSLSGDTSSVGLISRIIFSDSSVYFYGDHSISRHNLVSGKFELRLRPKDSGYFTGMFVTPQNTYINISSQGIFRLDRDVVYPVDSGYISKDDEILFSLPYDNNKVLLGKSNGDLLLFDGKKFFDYPIQDEGYLRQNILSEGLTVSDSLYAFSTLEGGALVIEKTTGKIKFTINYVNGLPDDEIFALGVDNNSGLWLSHQYGLTRADMRLPIDNFSIYPGLKGNLITSLWLNKELYVATSEGVYYLKEVKNYAEVEVLVHSKESSTNPIPETPGKMPLQLRVTEVQKPRRSIFSHIFGKNSPPSEAPEEKIDQQQVIISPQIRLPEPMHFKKIAGRLKSINYIYKKIEGLDEKCKQMVPAGSEILASTNKGLFLISDHKASAIVNSGYINNISSRSVDNRYYVATSEGYYYVTPGTNAKWSTVYPEKPVNRSLYSISVINNMIWAGGDDIVLGIHFNDTTSSGIRKYSIKTELPQRYIIESVNDTVFLFTLSKISYYSSSRDSFVNYRKKFTDNTKLKFVFSQPETPWIKTEEEWANFNAGTAIDLNDKSLLKIFDNLISINTDKDNIWVISGDNMIFRVVRNKIRAIKPEVGLFIRSISDAKGLNFKLSDIVFGSDDNTVHFDLVAPGYLKKNSTQYRYIVDREMTEWTKWSYDNNISMMIKPGKYTLRVKARDIWGNESEIKSIVFTIQAPFRQTTAFYLMILAAVILIVIGIVRFREKQLKKEKSILETKVKERTARIEAQKQEITSSIEYASRIQMAMLPEDGHFKKSFSDYFIIFNPRDIVSGDFYWIAEDEKRIYFTVADCTGHGVPGAFMSTLGISILDEIITNNPNLQANTVLNLLREKIKTSLHQTGKDGEATDGMDVALCILHKNRHLLEYSGAYNPMFLVHSGEFNEYRADRMPIGIYYGEKESFTNHEIKIQKGDTVYIFSDGFADQFGGEKGSKYMKYNLKSLLTKIHLKPMTEQKSILETEFENWKGGVNQIDDVTILGVKI